jgi:hypothetical protein
MKMQPRRNRLWKIDPFRAQARGKSNSASTNPCLHRWRSVEHRPIRNSTSATCPRAANMTRIRSLEIQKIPGVLAESEDFLADRLPSFRCTSLPHLDALKSPRTAVSHDEPQACDCMRFCTRACLCNRTFFESLYSISLFGLRLKNSPDRYFFTSCVSISLPLFQLGDTRD